MSREIAKLNFEGKLQTAIEGEPNPDPDELATAPVSQGASGPPARVLHFDGWGASIAFGDVWTRRAAAAIAAGGTRRSGAGRPSLVRISSW